MQHTHNHARSLHRLTLLQGMRPRNANELHTFIHRALGLNVGRVAVSAGSSPPMDYLAHAFFERGDCVVWANRGGGKTMLGAVATLLDLLFKPGIQVRILGGSLEQSSKMYEHLTALLERPLFRDGGGVLACPVTARRVLLAHGSRAEVLAGSQRSVRGTRVHKLRCDEVEEFQPDVWQAAQLVTRSGLCDGQAVRGSVEALSTMHRPFGLMHELVERAMTGVPDASLGRPRSSSAWGDDQTHAAAEGGSATEAAGTPTTHHPSMTLFKWNALDVVARCPAALRCAGCVLWDDCGGRAKSATGFVPVEDLIAQRRRTSDLTWNAEMMCKRPGVTDAVYPMFEVEAHVVEAIPAASATEPASAAAWGCHRSSMQSHADAQRSFVSEASGPTRYIAGMDFGLRSPHVMLWATVIGSGMDASVHVVAEYIADNLTLDSHLQAMRKLEQSPILRLPDQLDWVGADPAGHQRDRHTGLTDIAVVRAAGYRVRTSRSSVKEGIEIVRRRLDRQTLTIHPRCTQLIRALTGYRFDPADPQRETPLKDGPDHACDALRYMLVNLEREGRLTQSRSYLVG